MEKRVIVDYIFPYMSSSFFYVFRADREPETDVRVVKNDQRRASGLRRPYEIPPLTTFLTVQRNALSVLATLAFHPLFTTPLLTPTRP